MILSRSINGLDTYTDPDVQALYLESGNRIMAEAEQLLADALFNDLGVFVDRIVINEKGSTMDVMWELPLFFQGAYD